MNYPVIPPPKALAFYAEHAADTTPDVGPYVETRACPVDGPASVDEALAPLAAHAVDWVPAIRTGAIAASARNQFEASMAAPFHQALSRLPIPLLDDADFWRYLGLGPLRWFTLACDLSYVHGEPHLARTSTELTARADLREHPVLRTYLRGHMMQSGPVHDDYSAAMWLGDAALEANGTWSDTDVLKSHLIRVRIGETPFMAQAFLGAASAPYLPAGSARDGTGVRSFIKLFRRTRPQLAWEIYGQAEAAQLASELREIFDHGGAKSE
jgi:hypothetical protein